MIVAAFGFDLYTRAQVPTAFRVIPPVVRIDDRVRIFFQTISAVTIFAVVIVMIMTLATLALEIIAVITPFADRVIVDRCDLVYINSPSAVSADGRLAG